MQQLTTALQLWWKPTILPLETAEVDLLQIIFEQLSLEELHPLKLVSHRFREAAYLAETSITGSPTTAKIRQAVGELHILLKKRKNTQETKQKIDALMSNYIIEKELFKLICQKKSIHQIPIATHDDYLNPQKIPYPVMRSDPHADSFFFLAKKKGVVFSFKMNWFGWKATILHGNFSTTSKYTQGFLFLFKRKPIELNRAAYKIINELFTNK